MELVYLWVKEYKNIHKQGFNFSPKFYCDFDDKILTIKKNDNYISDFFGKDINITAIVGKNGSGKSSVLEYLSDSPKFIVTFENDEFQVSKNFKVLNKTSYKYNKGNINLNCIYIPPSDYLFKNFENFGDYSDKKPHKNNVFYEIFNQKMELEDINFQIIERQINMFLFSKNYTKEIIFPKNIVFSIVEDLCFGNFFDSSFFIKKIPLSEEIYLYAFYILERIILKENNKKIKYYLNKNKNKNLKELFFDFKAELDDLSCLEKYEEIKSYIEIFHIYKDTYETIEEDSNGKYKYHLSLKDFDKATLAISSINNELPFPMLSFKWDIDFSSGETIFINLLSILFYQLQKNKSLKFIYIDEGENFLHPNWQKKYISYIVQFIKDNFPNRKIHIILTSHSPFLLSDIPKQNIIFLNKDEKGNCKVVNGLKEKKQTFGANIHTLLSDSFFMEDGLMGEFAKSKINKIINFHKEVEEENRKEKSNLTPFKTRYKELKTKFWQTQSIIGEDYLKQVIKNHLRDIENILLGFDEAKKEEIKRLRAEADRLENM